jgi:hypothetical protein
VLGRPIDLGGGAEAAEPEPSAVGCAAARAVITSRAEKRGVSRPPI